MTSRESIIFQGIGRGKGENKAADAAKKAFDDCALTERTVQPQKIVVTITGNEDLGLLEVNILAEAIAEMLEDAGVGEVSTVYDTKLVDDAGDVLAVEIVGYGVCGDDD